jgi:GGDEF domain-containing protein
MFIRIIRDIRERRKERLLYKAKHDFLTGIPNRRAFMQQLNMEIENADKRNYKIALLYFDIRALLVGNFLFIYNLTKKVSPKYEGP